MFPPSKVGVHLKTPRFPIWVVCSESHFSVLFGLQRELLTNRGLSMEFELYYYDGLANQQEEIRLTVCMWHHLFNGVHVCLSCHRLLVIISHYHSEKCGFM